MIQSIAIHNHQNTIINGITYSIYKLGIDINNEFDSNIIYTDK